MDKKKTMKEKQCKVEVSKSKDCLRKNKISNKIKNSKLLIEKKNFSYEKYYDVLK